jgi:tRNA 2-selenouridine synthase
MQQRTAARASVAQLREFDEIIDVRSPSEFAVDHVPGALNCPVLDDAERARVGTLHKQVSAFDAKRVGAALVARNIAHHLEGELASRPRTWRPLVYCWRGGERSGAMVEVLGRIGWRAHALDGGYKAYRRDVVAQLADLPDRLSLRSICGSTGTGKSRLLGALAAAGAQVLDLEALASHKGSVLGDVPGSPQPGQRLFESNLAACALAFDPARPVYVESESRKIGALQVPEALIGRMRTAPCVTIEASVALRVALLREEYRHLWEDPAQLVAKLELLRPLHGAASIDRWKSMATPDSMALLVADLLERHYDPAYLRSMPRNYRHFADAQRVTIDGIDDDAMRRVALRVIALG